MMKKTMLMVLGLLVSGGAQASTYYWLVGESGSHEWGDATALSNWSTSFDPTEKKPIPDAHPSQLPTAADTICGYRSLMLDLKGQTLTTGGLCTDGTSPYTGTVFWGDASVFWHLTNGTLSVAYSFPRNLLQGDGIQVWNGATFECRYDLAPGNGMSTQTPIWIHSGGTVRAQNVLWFSTMLTIEPGGTFEANTFSMDAYSYSPECMNTVTNRGTVNFPNGLSIGGGRVAGYDNWGRLKVCQLDGVMTLGGPVSHNNNHLWLDFYLEGGTLRATADVDFANTTIKTVAENSVVTTDVAIASATLDMGDFVYGNGVTLVKQGPGRLIFGGAGNGPAAITVAAGGMWPVTREGETMSLPLTFEPGATLALNALGTTFASIRTVDGESLAVTLDATALQLDGVIARSDDATTRMLVKDGANAWFTANLPRFLVVEEGTELVLKPTAAHVFNAASGLPITDPAGWGEAIVPAGCSVDVAGEGTVLYDVATAPAFASVRVRDGATLCVTGGTSVAYATVPALELMGDAKAMVARGAYVTLTNNVACSTRGADMPVFEVATNAHVYAYGELTDNGETQVRSDIRFSDVDLRLYGQLMTPVSAETVLRGRTCFPVYVWLGTAEANRIRRFRFSGIGGSLYLRNYCWNYNGGYIYVACPEAGGRVTTDRTLAFKDFSFPIYPGGRSYNRTVMGLNNPTDEVVRVEALNTVFDVTDTSEIAGGVELKLGAGAKFSKLGRNYFQNQVKFTVSGLAKILFEDTEFKYPRSLYVSGQWNRADPLVEGVESLTLTRSDYSCWLWTGNGNGVFTAEDATWYVCDFMPDTMTQPYVYNTPPTPVFNGYREARLVAGSTFRLVGKNDSMGQDDSGPLEWDRVIDFARNVPITGGGNLLVSNLAPTNTMTATILGGANTCTGTAGVEPGTRSTLRFADGANWAGTVVANGNVELFATNALGVAQPAVVSFGSIRLDGEFPVRVWKDGGVATNDVLNLTAAFTGRGCLTGVPMAGYEPQPGDTFVIGRYPANAPLPKRGRRWEIMSEPTEDPEVVTLKIQYNLKGILLLVR